VASLSLLYMFRMLGLFMVFPVLSIFGLEYDQATPLLIGVALGGYGLTQAVFQIPLGMLSDVYGRKPIIVAGLVLFALGSVVAALSDSIWGLILGRLIQGAGAIASAVMALLSDLTSEENRTKAMAVVGVSIGISFTIAMVAGPAVAGVFGLDSVFWLSAMLACAGAAILTLFVPNPVQHHVGEHKAVKRMLVDVLRNGDLQRLDVGIFALHMALTAMFVVVPVMLASQGVPVAKHWLYYLPIMAGAFVLMLPFMYLSERKRKLKRVFLGAIAVVVMSELWLMNASVLWHWVFGLVMFFAAFNLLEATLPSLISKQAQAGSKGTAMGVYSTSQFLGAATGGFVGGGVYQMMGAQAVFVVCAAVCALWWLYALSMRPPEFLSSLVLPCVNPVKELHLIEAVPGVVEAQWVQEHGALYLKVDKASFDKVLLHNYLGRVA